MARRERTFRFLRLDDDLLSSKVMRRLRRSRRGDACVIAALKILLLALEGDGFVIEHDFSDTDFASDVALAIDEREDVVRNVVEQLEEAGWLAINEEGREYSPKAGELAGRITSRGLRKSRQAVKSAELEGDSVPSRFRLGSDSVPAMFLSGSASVPQEEAPPAPPQEDPKDWNLKIPSEKVAETPFERIVKAYGEICTSMPKCQGLTMKRTALVEACWKAHGERMFEAFRMAEESDFLSGRSGAWKGCGFDWLVDKDNMQKVLEGRYCNATTGRTRHSAQDYTGRYRGDEWEEMA